MFKPAFWLFQLASVAIGTALPAEYEHWTAAQKQEFLWRKQIVPTAYTDSLRPGNLGSACRALLSAPFSLLCLNKSFDSPSDVVPTTLGLSRRRSLHPMGTVAKASIGGVPALVRFSLAVPLLPGAPYVPGVAVKLFNDGIPSVNIHAIHSLSGQGDDPVFFSNSLSTAIPKPSGFLLKAGAAWFSLFETSPFRLGVKDAENRILSHSSIETSGQAYAIRFSPRPEVAQRYKTELKRREASKDFRDVLWVLGRNYVAYDVQGISELGEVLWSTELKIEESPLVSSFGEQELFFNHRRASATR